MSVLRNALSGYLEDGDAWGYHRCDGPLIDGTNPCTECHSISESLAIACDFVGMPDEAKKLRTELEEWKEPSELE